MGKIISSEHWQDGNVAVREIGNLARLGPSTVCEIQKNYSRHVRYIQTLPEVLQSSSLYLISTT